MTERSGGRGQARTWAPWSRNSRRRERLGPVGFEPASRDSAFGLCLALLIGCVAATPAWPWAWAPAVVCGALSWLGLHDLLQRGPSIQRNDPVIGHLRWIASAEALEPDATPEAIAARARGLPPG